MKTIKFKNSTEEEIKAEMKNVYSIVREMYKI